MTTATIRRGAQWAAGAAGVAAGAYAAYAAVTWLRYGRTSQPRPEEADDLLDRFMPFYEIVERHRIKVDAPAAITLDAAKDLDATDNTVARGLFKAREWMLGGIGDDRALPKPMIDQMQAIGWQVLAEVPGKEVVFGAATRPWVAKPEFRRIPVAEFAGFNEPDYVKIVFTLRADPVDDEQSVFRTETRAIATDPEARAKFRRYWAFVSPGVALIRLTMLGPIKCNAERRARAERELATV
jgi:hypothetical protein